MSTDNTHYNTYNAAPEAQVIPTGRWVYEAEPVPEAEAAVESKHTARTVAIIGAVLALLVAAGVITFALVGQKQSAGPVGYNDPVKLAASIEKAVNADNAAKGKFGHLTVACIAAPTARQFICNGTGTDGSHATVTATVNADGTDWITGAAGVS